MPYEALNIANYFLALSEPEKGDIISNLKIQKLLYYTQGFHLALYGTRLFSQEVYAWQYGPVVQEVYQEFRRFGANAIEIPENFDFNQFNKEELELLSEINDIYGQYSAVKLMNMTHRETPWMNTPLNGVISNDLMITYFSNFIEVDKKN